MSDEMRLRALAKQGTSPLGKAAKDEKDRLQRMSEDDLYTERGVLVAKANVLSAEYRALKRSITSIKDELRRRRSPDEPVISDHAVLRYIERYMGISTVEVRAKFADMARARIAEKKQQIVRSGDMHIAMTDNRVCTIWTEPKADPL